MNVREKRGWAMGSEAVADEAEFPEFPLVVDGTEVRPPESLIYNILSTGNLESSSSSPKFPWNKTLPDTGNLESSSFSPEIPWNNSLPGMGNLEFSLCPPME